MLLTVFLAIVFCAAMAMMLISCVAFIQDNKFFSSAPKEAREVLIQREQELFYGARAIGWTLFIISVLMILGVGVIAVWDGLRSGFTFWQFFLRFVLILTVYKVCDMALIDNFLLLKFHFFQHYNEYRMAKSQKAFCCATLWRSKTAPLFCRIFIAMSIGRMIP